MSYVSAQSQYSLRRGDRSFVAIQKSTIQRDTTAIRAKQESLFTHISKTTRGIAKQGRQGIHHSEGERGRSGRRDYPDTACLLPI